MFCDFTPLCVHTVMPQVIQPAQIKILKVGNQERHHNKTNTTPHHLESSPE